MCITVFEAHFNRPETCACDQSFTKDFCREKIVTRFPLEADSTDLPTCLANTTGSLNFDYMLDLSFMSPDRAWNWQRPSVQLPDQGTGKKLAVLAGTGPWDNYSPVNISATLDKAILYFQEQSQAMPSNASSSLSLRDQLDLVWVLPPAAGMFAYHLL